MNVYIALHKAIRENLFDLVGYKMAVYIVTKDLHNGQYETETLGNVNLKNKDSIMNFINQYGNHDVIGIRMLGIIISKKPLDYVLDYDKDMLMRLIEDEI